MDVTLIEKPPVNPYFSLFLGVIAVSTGAIFARMADAPPLVIAAYRLAIVMTVLLPLALIKGKDEIFSLSLSHYKLAIFSGFFLALHFAAWITSLNYTSVANSVVLVNTNPLWVAILTPFVAKERISKGLWISISICIIGCFIIGAGDVMTGSSAFLGDFLAILGSICAAFYLLLGRTLRKHVSLLSYITLCYGSAAVFLWIAVLSFSLKFTGFSPMTWSAFAGMAFVAQLIGHTCYNWALKWFSAGLIAVSLLGEPIGSSVLAFFLFDELPGKMDLFGSALILAGIYMAAKNE